MNTLLRDLRFAFRQLRKSPSFAAAAIITLAIGIGANTSIFTLVHVAMLRNLPVKDPAQLYRVGDTADCCVSGGFQDDWTIFSYPLYEQLRDNTPEFESLAASQTNRPMVNLRPQGAQTAQSLVGNFVSGNFFSTLGVPAYAGRMISPQDDVTGAPPVAVISYRGWQQQFGGETSAIGKTVVVDGVAATLIGVAPAGFFGDQLQGDPPEVWMPIHMEPLLTRESSLLSHRDEHWLYVIGRKRLGASPAAISERLTTELRQWLKVPGNIVLAQASDAARIDKQYIKLSPGGAGVQSMKEEYQQGLYLLTAASAVLLLIACANLANLLLARAAANRQRTAVQLAIGASRARVVRAKLTESLLLSVLGGAAGILVAYNLTYVILAVVFRGSKYFPVSAAPSLPVLGFTFLVALITGLLFGVAPAFIESRSNPIEALRGASRSQTDSSHTPQKVLIVVQAALSLVLMSVAGLLVESLNNLQHRDYGFEREHHLVVMFDPIAAGYSAERVPELYRSMEEHFGRLPGVTAVGLALYGPQEGNNWGEGIDFPGREHQRDQNASWDRVNTEFFDAIGAKIVRGRGITQQDTATSQPVAVVNEAFAKKFFPNSEVLGQHFGKGDLSHAGDYQIVGVVKDLRFQGGPRDVRPMFFVPATQTITYKGANDEQVETRSHFLGSISLAVQPGFSLNESEIRRTMSEVDPNLPPLNINTIHELMDIQQAQPTLISRLSSTFAGIALLLAAIGIYGVTAYRVARRTNEIGIRMALGADRSNIVALVLRSAFAQVILGLVIGIPLAFAAKRFMASQLLGISTFDVRALVVAIVVLAGSAAVATLLPARRAAAIEPMQALRAE